MKKVLIVGGGAAGLNLALRLEAQGRDYLLLEKSDRWGGRLGGELGFDLGFQVLQTNYPMVQEMVDLSSLSLRPFISGAYCWDGQGFRAYLNPLKSQNLLDALPHFPLGLKDLWALAAWYLRTRFPLDPLMPSPVSTEAYLAGWALSETFEQRFLRPFFQGIFLSKELHLSKTHFLFYLQQFLDGSAAIPQGGMQALVDQWLQGIPPHKRQLKAEVQSFGEGVLTLSSGESLAYDDLVLASDAYATAQLLGISLDASSFKSCQSFYFKVKGNRTNALPMLHLLPEGNELLHFYFLQDLDPSAPNLLSCTSLNMDLSAKEASDALNKFLPALRFDLERQVKVERALPVPGKFQGLSHAAQEKNVWLCGDYLLYPSLNAAMTAAKQVAELI